MVINWFKRYGFSYGLRLIKVAIILLIKSDWGWKQRKWSNLKRLRLLIVFFFWRWLDQFSFRITRLKVKISSKWIIWKMENSLLANHKNRLQFCQKFLIWSICKISPQKVLVLVVTSSEAGANNYLTLTPRPGGSGLFCKILLLPVPGVLQLTATSHQGFPIFSLSNSDDRL